MIILVCLDDNNGMRFNNRRQSRDQYLYQHIAELVKDCILWMNAGSEQLFNGLPLDIRVDPCFLEKAGEGEYCFVEDEDISNFLPNIEKLIVFRWNRVYPSDMKFPTCLLDNDLKKTDESAFPGKSHVEITQEVYLP